MVSAVVVELAADAPVDQPPGTGYSFIPSNGYLHELTEASAHLIKFMENFYTVFPELDGADVGLRRFACPPANSYRPTLQESPSQGNTSPTLPTR